MKTFTLLFLAGLFLINVFISQTPQESPELKEAATLAESALKLFNDGKNDEALVKMKQALEIQERLLPRTDSRIVVSLIYLGDIYIVKRNFDAAQKVLERAQGILAERSPPDDVSAALVWDRLAVLYQRKGEERKAEELYQRALMVREKAFGPEDQRVAYSLFALGEFYRSKRNFDRAAPNYKRALSIYGQVSGIKSAEFELTSDKFICLAFETGNPDSVKEVAEIRKRFDKTGELEGLILNGKAVSFPKPNYPKEARERRLSGSVVVKVTIDESGNVIAAHDLCQGPPYLSEASVTAARLAKFPPTIQLGKPVKVSGVLKYKYVAQ